MGHLTPASVGLARLRRQPLPRGFVRSVAAMTGFHESYVSNVLRQPHKFNATIAAFMIGRAGLPLPTACRDARAIEAHQAGEAGVSIAHLRQAGKRNRRRATAG